MTSPPTARPARPFWEIGYASALGLVDATMVTIAALLALAIRFGGTSRDVTGALTSGSMSISYATFIALLTPSWVALLALNKAYEPRLLGVGAEEFKRVVNASIAFVALITFVSYSLRAQVARGFVGVALPAGVLLLLLGRYACRRVLHALRRKGACLHRVVAVGSAEEVLALTTQMQREPTAGLLVVAVALPDYASGALQVGDRLLPDLGPARSLVDRLEEVSADTVVVAGTSAMSNRELRELSWQLERTGTDLIVAPAITDVTGPRIHVRPVAGLPLLQLEAPSFRGAPRVLKRLIDLVGALVLLLLLALPLLALSLLVRRDGGGPALVREIRVGLDGSTFRIIRFRTTNPAGGDELTRTGARLRRYSLDDLPMLLNVVAGTLSLVGPRPPLPSEVEAYGASEHRRLLVKPGITGLWHVSGRAALPWEETVRLDLYYVENWSVLLDVQILWKTFTAVALGRRAH